MTSDSSTTWVDITTLKLWDKNPNEGDIGAIMHSISSNGFNDTCHLWRGVVKAGNHSVMALTNLRSDGWHPDKCDIPSKCLKTENGAWHISMIDISEMSDIRSDAFGLALNRTQRLGQDDPAKLAELLQELANSDEIDITASGFDADELDELLRDLGRIDGGWGDAFSGLPDEDRQPFQQVTFTLHDSQLETVKTAISKAKNLGAFDTPNENSNGNALYRICEAFIDG